MNDQIEIKLKEVLSGDQADSLTGEILGARGHDLQIDAGVVSRIDTPCIEILLAAQKLWAEEDVGLNYTNTSENFETALGSIGLQKNMLETGVA